MLTLGLTSVTFRKMNVDKIIQIACENGLSCIEWGSDVHVPAGNLSLAAAVGEKTRGAGLAVCSYGSYFRLGQPMDAFRDVSATAKALGTQTIRIWAGDKSSADTGADGFEQLVSGLQEACAIAQLCGQTVCMEFHKNTYNDTAEACRKLLNAAGCGNAKTYWQPIYDKETELQTIRTLSPHITTIHAFHWDSKGKRFSMKKGKVWAEYACELKTLAGEHPILFEFVKHDNPRQLAKDVAALRGWFQL